MAYAKPLEQRLQMLEQKVDNLEKIFNEFLEKIFPTERVHEDEVRELKKRLEEILTAKEGECRIVFVPLWSERTILIVAIGHRGSLYSKIKKRI